MKKDITTIPISEVFEPKEGCPICCLRDMLESRLVEYVLGPSMMEPDVRMETNKLGFCSRHYGDLFSQRNKLPLALILESHLAHIKNSDLKRDTDLCFICQNVDSHTEKLLANLFALYGKEPAFRHLFSQQQLLCLPHYRLLTTRAKSKLNKKIQKDFLSACQSLAANHLKDLHRDITHFCSMFDWRSNSEDADWGTSKDAIERTIYFLTSRNV